jgi:peptide chain release factor subunit 1
MGEDSIYELKEITDGLLRELSLLSATERTVLSVYLKTEHGWDGIGRFIDQESKKIIPLLSPEEKDYFKASISFLGDVLKEKKRDGFKGPGVAFFADLGSDYLKTVELNMPTEPLLAVDKEAIIHPLALQYDEYERIGVIMIDAHCVRILLVTGLIIDDMDRFCKKIHHLSKVGGWSQMRYQRRRLKQVQHFARDVVDKAEAIFGDANVRRILIAGRDRMITALEGELSQKLKSKVIATVRWDLDAADSDFLHKVRPIMEETERNEEKKLLAKMIGELRRGGLGIAGVEETRSALAGGQVDTLMISGSIDAKIVEELTSLAKRTGAAVEFVPGDNKILLSIGGVGALLRYKL